MKIGSGLHNNLNNIEVPINVNSQKSEDNSEVITEGITQSFHQSREVNKKIELLEEAILTICFKLIFMVYLSV
jgi:hypothetical protein